MAGQQQVGPRTRARPLADHVAERVHADVAEPKHFEHRAHLGGAAILMKRGCRNAAEPDLILEHPRLTEASCLERGTNGGIGQQALTDLVG